jgi:hypothetical protein
MLRVEKILAYDRKLQVFRGPPAEMHVERHILGHMLVRKLIHVTEGAVKFHVMR